MKVDGDATAPGSSGGVESDPALEKTVSADEMPAGVKMADAWLRTKGLK